MNKLACVRVTIGLHCLAALLVCSASEQLFGQGNRTVKYVNTSNESVLVWFKQEGQSSYLRPPLVVGPKSEVWHPLSNSFRGKRYIVVQDEARRDTHIGWVDLEAIADSTTPVLLIDGFVVSETRTQTYTVQVPVMMEIMGPDGRPRTVTVYKDETRTREYVVKRTVFQMKAIIDGRAYVLNSGESETGSALPRRRND